MCVSGSVCIVSDEHVELPMNAFACGVCMIDVHVCWSLNTRARICVWPRACVDGWMQLDPASVHGFVERFFTFFLLNASFVPIGLYVTMKLARSFQKVFLERDQ
jgi:hypothetical protein